MGNKPDMKVVLAQLNQWCRVNNISVQSVYDQCKGMTLQELVYYLFGVVRDAIDQFVVTQGEFDELYKYVHDYFDNLDVQDEINKKLEEMYSSGELQLIFQKMVTSLIDVTTLGAVPDGVTDNTSVFNSLQAGKQYFIPYGKYAVKQITLPDNIIVVNNGIFVESSNTPANEYVITLGINNKFDNLTLEFGDFNNYRFGIKVRTNCSINALKIYSNTRTNCEGVHFHGNNIVCDSLITNNIMRGFEAGAYSDIQYFQAPVEYYSGLTLTKYNLTGVVQGCRVGRLENSCIGDGLIQSLIDNQTEPKPGYNSVYISGCNNISFGNIISYDSLEHAIRIGGDDIGSKISHDINFTNIYAYRSGGSSLKVNSNFSEPCYNVHVNNIYSIDNGVRQGDLSRRISALRVSHCSNFICENVYSFSDSNNRTLYNKEGDTDIIELNNVKNVHILNVETNYSYRSIVSFNENNDAAIGEEGLTSMSQLSCNDITLGNIRCLNAVQMFMRFETTEEGEYFNNINVLGLLCNTNNVVYGQNTPHISNINLFMYDKYDNARISGYANNVNVCSLPYSGEGQGILSILNQFDNTDASQNSVLRLQTKDLTNPAEGMKGATIVFYRVTGGRPGGAIGSYQYGAGAAQSGIAFYTSDTTVASNKINPAMLLYDGHLSPLNANFNLGDQDNPYNNIFTNNVRVGSYTLTPELVNKLINL